MDEAERCDEVAYIYQAKLMVRGTPGELKALPEVSPAGTRRVAVATSRPSQALAALKTRPFVLDATLVESEIHLQMPKDIEDAEVISAFDDTGLQGTRLRPIEPSLEDVFVTLTRNLSKQ
jgi:ABC-type multidrug transport system ATPase subunit